MEAVERDNPSLKGVLHATSWTGPPDPRARRAAKARSACLWFLARGKSGRTPTGQKNPCAIAGEEEIQRIARTEYRDIPGLCKSALRPFGGT